MSEVTSRPVSSVELASIKIFFRSQNIELTENLIKIQKWARLQLPNLQYVRTAWKEAVKPLNKVRMSRNIMVCDEILIIRYSLLIF